MESAYPSSATFLPLATVAEHCREVFQWYFKPIYPYWNSWNCLQQCHLLTAWLDEAVPEAVRLVATFSLMSDSSSTFTMVYNTAHALHYSPPPLETSDSKWDLRSLAWLGAFKVDSTTYTHQTLVPSSLTMWKPCNMAYCILYHINQSDQWTWVSRNTAMNWGTEMNQNGTKY